jgi:hypothetical protein
VAILVVLCITHAKGIRTPLPMLCRNGMYL